MSEGDPLVARVADLGYGAGWRLVRELPAPVVRATFDAAADLAVRRAGPGVRRLRANLARVRPDLSRHALDELTRAGMRSYARYWREAFRLPSADHASIRARVTPAVDGLENLEGPQRSGHPVILALTHSGNWDVAGLWAAHRYGGITTVAERLRPESLYERFVAYRESLGFSILPMTGGETPARGLLQALRAGGVVCLLAERDLSARGVPVDLCGARTSMPPGPATLAATTGADLLPVSCWFTRDDPQGAGGEGWGFRVHPPVPVPSRAAVPAATQAMADVFGREIAEHPADWHMLQRMWPDLP